MTELTPRLAASLANGVYGLTKNVTIEGAIKDLNAQFKDVASFSEDLMLKAKTGGPWFIKCRTAYGFTLIGKEKFIGQAFILFRGTQYLADWLTNLNVGASRSASGQPVHDGFNMSFNTMKLELTAFMNSVCKSNITDIHCIGHSLGGALATLCADWIRSSYNRQVYLYTFGSPRVGLYDFSNYCTTQVGAERIFRAYHKTDIVPCIPTWPFVHTPNSGRDYYLPSPGIIPLAEYHSMDRYIESVSGKSWAALANLRNDNKNDDAILVWLKTSSPTGITLTALDWMGEALLYILTKCMKGAAPLISRAVGTSFTIMDQLAYILKTGIDLSETTATLVQQLVRKIMAMLGMQGTLDKIDLTANFIRSLLLRLQQKVNEFVQSVLNNALVEGRAL